MAQRGHHEVGEQVLRRHYSVVAQIADVEHAEKVAIAGSPHVVFEPAGDVIGIAADDETVVAHLLEGGVGAGEVALDMLAMVEGAVGVESGGRGQIETPVSFQYLPS